MAEQRLSITPNTAHALDRSIEKWQGIVDGKKSNRGAVDCALCTKFIRNKDCAGCPVAGVTGKPRCEGTPYRAFASAQRRYMGRGPGVTIDTVRKAGGPRRHLMAKVLTWLARRELRFLQRVRDEHVFVIRTSANGT